MAMNTKDGILTATAKLVPMSHYILDRMTVKVGQI